jgi:hypothetical protein
MIRLFKRRKDKPSLMYPVFQRLGAVIDKRQRQCANFLLAKSEKLSRQHKFYWLVLFCLFFGGGSLYVLLYSIENKSDQFFIERMSFPQHVINSDTTGSFKSLPVLTEDQYQKIKRLKKYMDSLRMSPSGKVKYDSIIQTRAGFLDSMLFIENIYQQQLKSK